MILQTVPSSTTVEVSTTTKEDIMSEISNVLTGDEIIEMADNIRERRGDYLADLDALESFALEHAA